MVRNFHRPVFVFLLIFFIYGLAVAQERTYSRTEVSRHKTKPDCWLIIHGKVYNVTQYVERHMNFDFDISPYCGKDASKGWDNKPEVGGSHSRKAALMLRKYLIGKLEKQT